MNKPKHLRIIVNLGDYRRIRGLIKRRDSMLRKRRSISKNILGALR